MTHNIDSDSVNLSPAADDTKLVPQFIVERGYTLSEVIGSGQYSRVYRARKTNMERDIACKRIVIQNTSVEWRNNCLKQEMTIMKRLKHPHIVQVYDLFKTRRLVFIFMELAVNGTIASQLEKEQKPLKESVAINWFRQLIGAISYMHSKFIAHRDIKPDNFLLNKEYDALVCDFGFAVMSSEKPGERLVRSTQCGTAVYMAPEVQKASKKDKVCYDAKAADIYSMGICLFEMINFDKPFPDELSLTPNELFNRKLKRDYRLHSKLEHRISKDTKELVRKLLEPEPSKRITAEDAIKDTALKVKSQT